MVVEKYANAFWTHLTASMLVGDFTAHVALVVPVALRGGQFRVSIDSELLLVTAGEATMTWTVTRAIEGTTAAPHGTGSSVAHVLSAAGLLGATGAFDVRAYGAKGDHGVTDDTAAIQAAFDAVPEVVEGDWASRGWKWAASEVVLPPGIFRVGTINYRGQSIRGAGMYDTILLGKPGQDVLHLDPSLGIADVQGTHWRDFTIRVDDSTNASASFPQRGGVGNAGFVVDFADGSVTPPMALGGSDISNVQFESTSATSGGQNASCGIFTQGGVFNLSRFRNVKFYRLAYGFWDSYPTSNLTSVELYRDHNHYDSLYFNSCGYGWRLVNQGFGQITNLVMHANTIGLGFKGVQSEGRRSCWNLQLDTVFIEDSDVSIDCPYDAERSPEGLKFSNIWIAGSAAEVTVVLGVTSSTLDRVFIASKSGAYPVLQLTGARGSGNALSGVILQNYEISTATYQDSGVLNRIVSTKTNFDYAQITSPVGITATTEATATVIVAGAAVAYDGLTSVLIEFFAPMVGGAAYTYLCLYDGASSIGFIGMQIEAANSGPTYVRRVLTPSAGSHTYSMRGKVSSGTSQVQCGAGGVGVPVPAFMRIMRA